MFGQPVFGDPRVQFVLTLDQASERLFPTLITPGDHHGRQEPFRSMLHHAMVVSRKRGGVPHAASWASSAGYTPFS